jgi:hypothetical protein
VALGEGRVQEGVGARERVNSRTSTVMTHFAAAGLGVDDDGRGWSVYDRE